MPNFSLRKLYEMYDFDNNNSLLTVNIPSSNVYWFLKRVFDLLISVSLIPVMLFLILITFFLNPYFNKGSIFYIQTRMGKNCKPFKAIKFRTMTSEGKIKRGYNDPIEIDRITPLGRFLRKVRIDEIPQILNVLVGDMSLIGPRPDYYQHALYFLDNVEGYRSRHLIRPGLSGLSQIKLGYAAGVDDTNKKTMLDIYYINNAGYILDIKIFFGTIKTVFKGFWNN